MLTIAIKMIRSNRSRLFFTVLGFVVSALILIFGLYYMHVSKSVVDDSLRHALQEQRVLINQVSIPCVEYYESGDKMIPNYLDVSANDILAFQTIKGVSSICVEYTFLKPITIQYDNIQMLIKAPSGVDPTYTCFSEALVSSLSEEIENFTEMVAGEKLSNDDPMTLMLNEVTVASMGLTPDEVIGKKVKVSLGEDVNYTLTVVGVYSYRLSTYWNEDIKNYHNIFSENEKNMVDDGLLFNSLFFKQLSSILREPKAYSVSNINCTINNTEYINDFVNIANGKNLHNAQSDYLTYYEQIAIQKKMSSIFLLVGLFLSILVLLMIINTIAINISQQKKFLGLMSLLGYNRQRISFFYACQSMGYSFIGTIIGSIIAYVLCTYFGLNMLSSLKNFGISSNELLFPVSDMLLVIVLIVGVSALAGYVVAVIKTRKKH